MPDPHPLLTRIHDRLNQGIATRQIIEEFLPATRAEALAYARRLPLWDEYRGGFSPQVVAIARVLSRRGMSQFGFILDRDGHVAPQLPHRGGKAPAYPRRNFPMRVGDEEVRVEYAPYYFPNSDQDLFTFISPHQPPRPHPLSETGFWSHFTSRDAVEACGGPEPYAALLAEAMLQDDRSFDAAFHGATPEHVTRQRKPVAARSAALPEASVTDQNADARPASGPHSARVLADETGQAEPQPAKDKPRQRFLF